MRAATFALALLSVIFVFHFTSQGLAQVLPSGAAEQEVTATDETLKPLIEVLEDPEARERLLNALREEAVSSTQAASEDRHSTQAFATRVAEVTAEAVNDVIERATQVLRDVQRLGVLPSILTEERRAVIASESLALLLTIVSTIAIYGGLRLMSRRVRLAKAGDAASMSEKAVVFAVQFVLRVASVLVAWIAGYGLAAFVINDGSLVPSQALYLNAFLLFGAFSVALSALVSRYPEDITFAHLPQKVAKVIYKKIRLIFGILFYGLIAAVPIAQAWTNFVVSRSLRTVILTVVAIVAIWSIRRISYALQTYGKIDETPVASGELHSEGMAGSFVARSTNTWDRLWPWLAYIYVAVAYSFSLANPNQMMDLVGRATLMSALAFVLILIALRLSKKSSDDLRFTLPGMLDEALPTLAPRLSTFLPTAVLVAAAALIFAAVLLIASGWRLLDVAGWLSGTGFDLISRLLSVALILIALAMVWAILTSWIDRRLSLELTGKAVSARSRTLLALFSNAVTIALVVFGGMIALSELGVDIAPLLAGAGVIGLAVGFGAQKLVQDIITGIFIQLENAINEGDVVTVAGITGGVEKLTIRSVGIRDMSGVYHLIPFSAVDTVGNYMRLFAYHVEVVGIAYDSDLDVAERAMHDAFDAVKAGNLGAEIIAPLEFQGVVALGDSAVNLRARIKTKPGQQWAVGRAYTREVKRALDAAGIEIPFPHRELKLPQVMLDRLIASSDKSNAVPT